MKKFIQITLLFLISLQVGTSQSFQAYMDAAESAFLDKDYYSSLSFYKEALSKDENNTDLLYKVAESARLFNSYTVAEANYAALTAIDTSGKYPMATYWLAEMKQKQGKYDEAAVLYNSYMTEYGKDGSYYSNKADKEMKSCEWSKGITDSPDESVVVTRLGSEINTPYSEFSGISIGDDLNYASMQFVKEDDKGAKRNISKIMKSENGELGEIIDGGINDDIHSTGNISYSSDGSYMYYTKCDYINSTDIRCDLYYRAVNGGSFGEAVKLPSFINSDDYTSTQPSVAHDAKSGKDLLYFVSDRDGGKGKLDIWYTMINGSNEFSEPINVASINTSENEITPFCNESTGELYFSSDGYQGLGGYDVYVVTKDNEKFSTPTHLGPPTNSSYNDIYYTVDKDGTVGHMSSNRKGSLYLDDANEGCCYDIYKIDIEPVEIDLLALTYDKNTKGELNGTTVKLYDAETDELLETVHNDSGYDHNFKLKRNRCYYIVAEKIGYTSDKLGFCTNDIKKSETITKKLYLGKDEVALDVYAFDKSKNNAELKGCKFTLTDSADRKNSVVRDNPNSNDFHFKLQPGKTYTLVGVHPRYGRKTMTINSSDVDASGRIVKKIYCGKKQSGLNLFLPLVLYFDNDRPGRRTNVTTTSKSYTETYTPYIVKKGEFMKKGVNANAIGQFFDVDVRGGYEKMKLFLEGLTRALGNGERLNVVVKGYASPRAKSDYNLKLGQRRVMSLKNEINRYGGGVLKRYIQNGQLRITDVSFGENTAPGGINDQYQNEKLSVYSVEASRERRVEILKVNTIR